MIKENIDLKRPLLDIFPESWKDKINATDNLEFRNLTHFKNTVSKLKQREDNHCGVSYRQAVEDLNKGRSLLSFDKAEIIKKQVKASLLKRGLITEEVYEDFKYADSGTQVGIDVAKFSEGDPNCVITPSRQYVNFFYELYISISYPAHVENSFIMDNVVKLLATIEELEKQKIFIKVTLVLPVRDISIRDENFFMSVPMFSHNEVKTAESMCSVINDRLLRKFCFAIFEDIYGNTLRHSYGNATSLEKCMNLGDSFDEAQFFEKVKNEVGA